MSVGGFPYIFFFFQLWPITSRINVWSLLIHYGVPEKGGVAEKNNNLVLFLLNTSLDIQESGIGATSWGRSLVCAAEVDYRICFFTKLFYALALLYLFGETIFCTSFALSWSAAMAAICARLPGTLLKSPLFRGGIAYQNISRQSRKQLQQRLTWSQLKHLHSRSALTVPTHFQQSSRLDYVWCVYSQPTFCFVVSFATNERN